MQSITILLERNAEGQIAISYHPTEGISPEAGESACRFVAEQFRQAAIEARVQAEVERRLEEQEADDAD